MTTGAVVVAAGIGRRMGTEINKVLLPLLDRPILAYSLETLQASPRVDRIAVVTREEDRSSVEDLCVHFGIEKARGRIVLGGTERFDSVRAGLECLSRHAPDNVLIQDGARPFLTQRMIDDTLEALTAWAGAIIGVPSKDTIKVLDDSRRIIDTPDRPRVWLVQTPQTFRYQTILNAYRKYTPPPYPTDDAWLLEQAGKPVTVVEGASRNIKITTSEDVQLAEFFLRMGPK